MKCISCGCWLSNMGYEDMVCILSGFRGGEDLGILILLSFPALVLKILSFALFYISLFWGDFLWPLLKFHNITIFLRLYVFFPRGNALQQCSRLRCSHNGDAAFSWKPTSFFSHYSFHTVLPLSGNVMIILVIVNH